MPKKKLRRRLTKKLTAEDKKRHDAIREEIDRDMPRLNRIGRQAKQEYDQRRARLVETLQSLKRAREELGLSLSDVAERTGIDKGNLSRLENLPNSNPTIETLNRYAEAVGCEIVIELQAVD